MIHGEIYINDMGTIFIYRGEWSGGYRHYACMLSAGVVLIHGHDLCSGNIGDSECRLANQEEVDRFLLRLHENGYHYNVSNCKIIELN